MEAYDVKRRSARIQIAVNGMVFDVSYSDTPSALYADFIELSTKAVFSLQVLVLSVLLRTG